MTSEKKSPHIEENPLLADTTLPGETFRLPSCGLLYSDGELSDDVVNGEVCVYPMTTIDDIRVRTPDKLFSGDAVTDVISRCVPQVKKPKMLMGADVDFIMLCLRQLSYGDIINVPFTHTCKKAKEHEYNISTTDIIKKSNYLTPALIKTQFIHEFTDLKRTVYLRLPLFSDTVELMKMSQNEESTPEELRELIILSFMSVIKSVNDTTNREYIQQWFCSLTPKHTKLLKAKLNDIVPIGPDFKQEVKCPDCNKPIKFNLPINPVDFFS